MALLAALVTLLGSAPTVSLSADSSCAPREVLSQELSGADVTFVPEGGLTLRLEKDGRLTLEKEGRVVLSRSLGNGTCDELGRAAAVVIIRWAHELAFSLSPAGERGSPVVVPTVKPAPVKPGAPPPPITKPIATAPVIASPKGELPLTPTLSPAGEREAPPLTPTLSPAGERETGTPPIADVVAVIGTTPPTTSPTLSPAGERETEVAALPPIRVTSFEALAGGGVTAPGATDPAPVISLELALTLNEHLRVDLAGLFDFGGHVAVLDEAGLTRGTLATRGGLVVPGVGYCFISPVRLCLGALAGLRIVEGESSGPYVFKKTLRRVAPFVVGPNAQLALTPGPFRVALDAALLITPIAPAFSVEGLDTTLRLPTFQALFRLSIGFGATR